MVLYINIFILTTKALSCALLEFFCCIRNKAFINCSRTFFSFVLISSAVTSLRNLRKTYDIGDEVTVPVNDKACIRKCKFL